MLKSCMKVSVVVPAYNEEKYIKSCLEAVTNQELKADEIIVVDNNCTDDTVKIAKEYNVTVIQEKKQGLIHARNKGFNTARYDIIARCDADAKVPKNWIKKIRGHFEDNTVDGLTGSVIFYDLPFKSSFFSNVFLSVMKSLQNGKDTLIGPNMAIKKSIWQKIKDSVCLDDKKVHEDIDLAIHILEAGGVLKVDKSLIVEISGRRIKSNPLSFFIEYPVRIVKTLRAPHL